MDAFRQDLRFALRGMARNPGLTLVILLTLALGIGANTAVFSLMDQVLLRRLPVRDPGRLVVMSAPGRGTGTTSSFSATRVPISRPMFEDLRDRATVFSGVLAYWPTDVHLGVAGTTAQASADLVSGTYFEVLGVRPLLGRLIAPADDRVAGGHGVVVLGHGCWERRFASDAQVVGRSVSINGTPMTVIGVSPPGFHGVEVGRSPDLFLPVAMQPVVLPTWRKDTLTSRRVRWLTPIARLRDGVTLEQAAAGANVLYRQILEGEIREIQGASERFQEEFLAKKLLLLPAARGTSELRAQSGTALLVLMAMVGLVLLIACANVANLLLARASARQREVAVRLALGAGRARLVRQFLVESVALALPGGAAGILVSSLAADLLLGAYADEGTARAFSADPDLRVAAFAFAVSVLTGVLFGLAPALQATRPAVFPSLKSESGSVLGGTVPFRFRKGLVIAQVALSLLLLIGAGLFTRSLANLLALDPGFDGERLLAFTIDPSLNGYDDARTIPLLERVQAEISAEPGVASVSMTQIALMTGSNTSSNVSVEGYEEKEGEDVNPNFTGIGSGYFRTLRTPLLAGRDFREADAAGAPQVAIVNEAFVRYFLRGRDPIGRRFAVGKTNQLDIEIVGVVKDGLAASMRETPRRYVYLPIAQRTAIGHVTYYVRHAASPDALAAGRLRRIVGSIDPGLPVTDLKTMRAQIGESLLTERLVAFLSAVFGLLATLLAALGLYGVMSYAVTMRTREIGLRMALGAERARVVRLVLREVAILTAAGVALGLPAGYGLGRLIESQLYGLTSRDPLSFLVATVTLLAASLLAGYLPAARAARVDPMMALRHD